MKQSTVVRWLSLIHLLESIVRSFKVTKTILFNRGQTSRLNVIDEDILKQLVCLLKPFKHMLQMVQTGNEPSLYMVLICSLTLKTALSSFDEILKYQKSTTNTDDEQDQDRDIDGQSESMIESEGNV